MTYSVRGPDAIVGSRLVADIDKDRARAHAYRVGPIYELEGSDGNFYYEIKKYGQKQLFYSRLFKGILHVADVVPMKDGAKTRYLSRKVPLNHIHKPLTRKEVQAEIDILYLIFEGWDRNFKSGANIHLKRAWFKNPFRWRAALFDFEGFGIAERMPQEIRVTARKADKQYMLAKLHALKERVSGEEGLAFVLQINKSIYGSDTSKPDRMDLEKGTQHFCKMLIRALDDAIYALSNPPTSQEIKEWENRVQSIKKRFAD